LDKETIDLDNTAEVSINELSATIPETAPRFTFYNYNGSLGKTINITHIVAFAHHIILVFIYTCPSGSKIRERMLYSSSKANVITAAENDASIKISKKVDQLLESLAYG
jgi:twinfilin-like protein